MPAFIFWKFLDKLCDMLLPAYSIWFLNWLIISPQFSLGISYSSIGTRNTHGHFSPYFRKTGFKPVKSFHWFFTKGGGTPLVMWIYTCLCQNIICFVVVPSKLYWSCPDIIISPIADRIDLEYIAWIGLIVIGGHNVVFFFSSEYCTTTDHTFLC